jgi:hypothetical protein
MTPIGATSRQFQLVGWGGVHWRVGRMDGGQRRFGWRRQGRGESQRNKRGCNDGPSPLLVTSCTASEFLSQLHVMATGYRGPSLCP